MMRLRQRTRTVVALTRRGAVCLGIACACCAAFGGAAAPGAEEDDVKFDIHEFSLWGFDPTLEQANQVQHFPTTLPGVVNTDRSRAGAEGKIAPFSLMTFHGEAVKNLEIDLRVQAGRFAAHWPAGETKSGRLRWLDVVASPEASSAGRFAPVDARHWFNAARELDSLFLQSGARNERFLIYDAELKLNQPLQISGGPDRYRLANLGKTPLYDVLVVAPEGQRRRIGRLDLLPGGKATDAKPSDAKPADVKPADVKPAESKPSEVGTPADGKPAAKAEPEATAPKAEAPAAPQVVAAPTSGEPKVVPLRGSAASPASPPANQAAVVGEAVEMEMSPPLDDGAEELAAAKQWLAESLRKQGFSEKEVDLIMERAAPAIFGAKELLVVCRLPAEAIEERLPLVTYPAARKTIRVAWVCSRNVDPKIKEEVKLLVAQLASAQYSEREAAEKRLLELGRLAVPALKEALKSADPEVQFRVERLLLAQNEKI